MRGGRGALARCIKHGRQEIGFPQPGQNVTPDGRRCPHSGQKAGASEGGRERPEVSAERVYCVCAGRKGAGGCAAEGAEGTLFPASGFEAAIFLYTVNKSHAARHRQANDAIMMSAKSALFSEEAETGPVEAGEGKSIGSVKRTSSNMLSILRRSASSSGVSGSREMEVKQ